LNLFSSIATTAPEQRRGARDRHRLNQADFKLEIDGGALLALQLDAGASTCDHWISR
jgi:hypothetical protein